MALKFPVTLGPVQTPADPADAVTGRSLHVLDGDGKETVITLTPDTTETSFVVLVAPGKTGQCALVDTNRNGDSEPSAPAMFPLDMPAGPGPVPPTPEQPIVGLPSEVPDPTNEPTAKKSNSPGWPPKKK